jgi:hypothetical protein
MKITVTTLPPRESDLDAAYHDALRDIILLCPNLESFCIYGRPQDQYGLSETTMNIFRALPDHLRMCAWADLGETIRMSLFRDSCSFFSVLEHLRLRGMWGFLNEEVILTLPRLRSLSFASWITNYPIAQWDLPSLVWLEISVESAVWLEELDGFFSRYGKKLEFLQLVAGDLAPQELNHAGAHRLYSIEIPLNFFQYFPSLDCLSIDPSWMRFGITEEPESTTAHPHTKLTTLHILRPDPRHGPYNSCSNFLRSFSVVYHDLFPRLTDISFTLNGRYIVMPMSHPWFWSGVGPTREELANLGDGIFLDLVDHAYF